jgi:hypothetical protein
MDFGEKRAVIEANAQADDYLGYAAPPDKF